MSSSPSSAEVAHHGASDSCLNCGVALMPNAKYCHVCGQDTANHPPSLFEFVHEFITHYVALEGTLWRSLKALALRPGFLTQEYLAGRKARYVLPLRLLLTLGFLFFLLVKVSPEDPESAVAAEEIGAVMKQDETASAVPRVNKPASAAIQAGGGAVVLSNQSPEDLEVDGENFVVLNTDKVPAWLKPQLEAARKRWSDNPQAEYNRITAKVRGLLPYAVLCSQPFFAAILALVFWRRRLTYGAHFVFALHLHAFFYLGLMLSLIPVEAVGWLAVTWLMLYPLLAIKRVYGQRWGWAVGSSAVVFALHTALLLLMFASVFAIGALAP